MSNPVAAPLVSVLMPAYNHAPYVRAAVESVVGQTYANLEFIVIDDASADDTWSVLQSFDDARMRLLRHETNQGAHATLNEALALATGEFVAILNSDDVYHPARVETLVSAAKRGGEDTLIFTDVEFIDAQGAPADEHPRALGYRTLRARCATLPPSLWLLTGNPAISTSNFFCSRTLAQATGPFAPLRYTHDWDWALRASSRVAPTWVREPLLSYRVHAANTLSEDDTWRHVHENSYIQAKALQLRDATRERRPGDVASARMACLALLANESFHPLALSLYLTCLQGGIDDGELLALSCTRDGNWFLKQLADAASCPASLFGPLGTLAESENVIAAQRALIDERWNVIQKMTGDIAERDKTIAAQSTMAEERWQAMQEMGETIAERDTTIAAQAAMIEERWDAIQEMGETIAERDRTIAAQAAMAEERWQALQEMGETIAERDTTIAAQAAMIEERWDAIQQMGAEIASRDSKIGKLEKDLARPLVRIALFIHRKLG